MARHKEFDQDIALDKAMTLFWQKGYEATSIQDLVDHMGIGRRSLYDTFNSKHDLFIAALDRYRDIAKESILTPGEPLISPKAVIQEIFEGIVSEALVDRNRKGCFKLLGKKRYLIFFNQPEILFNRFFFICRCLR